MIGEFSPPLRLPAAGADPATAGPARAVQADEGAAQRIGSKAVKRKQWFGRRARGTELLLANARAFGKQVHSTCSPRRPGRRRSRPPDRDPTFDRTLLSHWHPTGEAPGWQLGNPWGGALRAGAGRAAAAARVDIQRQPVPLVLVERDPHPRGGDEPRLAGAGGAGEPGGPGAAEPSEGSAARLTPPAPSVCGGQLAAPGGRQLLVLNRGFRERPGTELQQWRIACPGWMPDGVRDVALAPQHEPPVAVGMAPCVPHRNGHEIGMMDLGPSSARGAGGEMALLLASTPKIPSSSSARPAGQAAQEADPAPGRAARRGDALPVPVALEQERSGLLHQAHRLPPLPELVKGRPRWRPWSSTAPSRGMPSLRPDAGPSPPRGQPAFIEKWRSSLVGSLPQLQQQIAEAEREKQRQEMEDQLLANRTPADAPDPHPRSAGGLWGSGPGQLAQAQPGADSGNGVCMLQQEPPGGDRRLLGRSGGGERRRGQDAACAGARAGGGAEQTTCPTIRWGVHPASDLMRLCRARAVMLALPERSSIAAIRAAPAELPSRGHPATAAPDAASPEQGLWRCNLEAPSSSALRYVRFHGATEECAGALPGSAQGGDEREAGRYLMFFHRGGGPSRSPPRPGWSSGALSSSASFHRRH